MIRLTGLVLVAIMWLAGCGAGDDGGSSAEALSRSEYIEAADRLCLDFMETSDAFPEPQTPEEVGELLDQAIELAENTSAAFAALRPPREAETVHQALRASLDDSLVKVREARRAVDNGDLEAVGTAMDDAVAIGQRSDQAAKDFGLLVCGSEAELRSQS